MGDSDRTPKYLTAKVDQWVHPECHILLDLSSAIGPRLPYEEQVGQTSLTQV
eukprot:CAMPEP_0184332088 /NCGR_PEP_ID=MMETSP1089-20130417/1350_1 /TAXON_ID=38269 ORGANISM="Gloeochaete wittrockiana, Strain SAG46.84" /NCGR_SAMPLE_ID=MMETSP1089 /ASSEMBLY_ACC=CAM_ASM_000445 /LENGTH=51 /DNA_ID=CAMNT_0026655323 /DNA_START=627 /DNA_END=782 /DNA_ORIENTATION=-